jgi:hypothetical protein
MSRRSGEAESRLRRSGSIWPSCGTQEAPASEERPPADCFAESTELGERPPGAVSQTRESTTAASVNGVRLSESSVSSARPTPPQPRSTTREVDMTALLAPRRGERARQHVRKRQAS